MSIDQYFAQFAGDTPDEIAMLPYEGRRYRVTAALEQLARSRTQDGWAWAIEGKIVEVVAAHGARVSIAECNTHGPRWEIGGVPPGLLEEVMSHDDQ